MGAEMRVYVLRHGKAERDSPSGTDDDRALMARGKLQARFLADMFEAREAPLDEPPVAVFSSPVLRAARTARLVAEALDLPVKYEEALRTDQPVSGALELVRGRRGRGPVLLVGHNPQLEGLIRILAPDDPRVHEPLRTGELVLVRVVLADDPPRGVIDDRVRLDE